MADDRRYLFVSYARGDFDRVRPFTDAVIGELSARGLPIELWMDVTHLQPGEHWADAIADALESSIGFLVFVSSRSTQSLTMRSELDIALRVPDRLIIPVVLDEPADPPPWLAERQWLWLTDDLSEAAGTIADATERYLAQTPSPTAPVTETEAPLIAADIANDLRSSEPAAAHERPRSVFVVHGHDTAALAQLEDYLASVDVTPVILARQDKSPQSLFQKFMTLGAEARFAIVLLGADDYGASRLQYEAPDVGDRALQFRARQNVVLELGFFYGRLGWENVFVVYHAPDEVFPNFERPSDLDGVVFDSLSDDDWRVKLGTKLAAAGFELDGSRRPA